MDILLVPKVVAGAFKERRPPFLQSDGLLEVILVWQQASVRHSAAVLRSCPEVSFGEITVEPSSISTCNVFSKNRDAPKNI